MKKSALVLVLTVVVAFLLIRERHRIIFSFSSSDSPPELLDAVDEGPSVRWHDDYYIIQAIDSKTFAIGEPRYNQQNVNYLIVGSERAILFDAGSGYRDIRPVASALTDRPITFLPSHFHYDHVGNGISFDRLAVVDLPHIRKRVDGNELRLTWEEHLGSFEGYDVPTWTVHKWLAPGEMIQLGDRELQVLFTPGHTDDSVSLLDAASSYLFSGDFIYPGPLYAFLPTSNMGSYLQGTNTMIAAIVPGTRIFGAHRSGPPGAPEQTVSDVRDLRRLIEAMKAGEADGEGIYPVTYIVNPAMQLLAEPAWLQDWDARYPDL